MVTSLSLPSVVESYDRLSQSANLGMQLQAQIWYREAQQFAQYYAERTGLTLEQSASVVSAFSPRVTWARNQRLAREYFLGLHVKCLSTSLRNAQKASVEGFSALRGQKTNAFARAIAGDMSAVVIDTWMMKACGFKRKSPNKSEYNLMADAVREVAQKHGWENAHMQALIWIVARERAD